MKIMQLRELKMMKVIEVEGGELEMLRIEVEGVEAGMAGRGEERVDI